MNCVWVKDHKCPHEGFPASLTEGVGAETELEALRLMGKLMMCHNCLLGMLIGGKKPLTKDEAR